MTENVPPSSTAAAAAAADASTRGIPYYEKLKRDLRETLQKKRLLDKNLATLEDQIYRIESTYLEETSGAGNIIKGFDNYIKGSALIGSGGGSGGGGGMGGGGGGGGTSTRRKGVGEMDRVFSRSSCSFMREVSPTSSIHSTPTHAPTPTSGQAPGPSSARASDHPTPTSATGVKGGGGAANKKARKATDKEDEESEGKQPKRLKITYARGGTGD
ncbi:MAG: hypothetical protein LQ350_003392 [Teloschistes chrysophthalmus]|nr:MAG: hypothetical protein LQ350_003392 [Niorma chrysophthalma]